MYQRCSGGVLIPESLSELRQLQNHRFAAGMVQIGPATVSGFTLLRDLNPAELICLDQAVGFSDRSA